MFFGISEYIYDMSLILEGGIMSVKQEGQKGVWTKNGYQTSMFDTDIEQIALDLEKKYDDLGKVNLDQLCENEERLALVRQISEENHFGRRVILSGNFEKAFGWVAGVEKSDFNSCIRSTAVYAGDVG